MTRCLRRAKEQLEQLAQPFCAESGLTPTQLRLLMALYFEGPQTATALARTACMAGANTSALCKRLAQQGLIDRRRDETDERQVVVSLTLPGEKLVAAYLEGCKGQMQAVMERSTPEDLRVIEAGLLRLSRIMDKGATDEQH